MTLEEMKRIKEEKGFSLAQLSEKSGVPLGTLQKIFTGETARPRYSTRQALEKALLEQPVHRDDPRVAERIPSYGKRPVKRQGEYTLEDYYALPEERRVELIDGVIYDMASPTFTHQRISASVLHQIMKYLDEKNGKCIALAAPVDVRLDRDDKTMVQPDVMILCDHDKICNWGIDGAPDFVLEIISQASRRKDYITKLQKYADAGVREYWILDPEKKNLITYDFAEEGIPHIYPLRGNAEMALYGGELKIDLDELAGKMLD